MRPSDRTYCPRTVKFTYTSTFSSHYVREFAAHETAGEPIAKTPSFPDGNNEGSKSRPPLGHVCVYASPLHIQRTPRHSDAYVHEGEPADVHEPATRRRFPFFRRHAWQTSSTSATSPSVSRILQQGNREIDRREGSGPRRRQFYACAVMHSEIRELVSLSCMYRGLEWQKLYASRAWKQLVEKTER